MDALNGLSEAAEEWEDIELMVDSGAGTTVIGQEHAKAVQAIEPNPTANYKLADGSIIHNHGRKKFVATTEDWELKTIRAAVTKVDTPLLHVSALVLVGGTVVFSPNGSYIESKTGHQASLTASKGSITSWCGSPRIRPTHFKGRPERGCKTHTESQYASRR